MHTLAIFILSFSLLICNNFFLSVRFWTFIEWKKVACDAHKKCVYFKTYNKHIKVANVNNATATIKVKLPACKRHRKEWWNCFYLLALLNSMNVESVYLASSGFYLVQHQQSRHKIYSHNNGMFAGLNFSNFHSRLGKLCVCANLTSLQFWKNQQWK